MLMLLYSDRRTARTICLVERGTPEEADQEFDRICDDLTRRWAKGGDGGEWQGGAE